MRHISLFMAAALSAPTFSQGLDVAIVAAATTSSADCRFTDPQAFLLATGFFNRVDIINITGAPPTLAQLAQYDAVVTWSNSTYNNAAAAGDAFADYVDQGGGVVVCMFALGANSTPLFLSGRWVPNYELVQVQVGQTTGNATLGNVLLPNHPIMSGVTSFDGGTSSYRPTVTALRSGAQAVAEWSDGRVLAAVGALPNRADLTFYPPSSQCRVDFWNTNTDGARLLANALVYVAGGDIGNRYCTPAIANSTGQPALIRAAGSSQVSNNNLTLTAEALPLNAFGFFLTSRTQGAVNQPGGSQGRLCLGGAIGRYVGPGQIKNSGTTGSFALLLNLNATPQPSGSVAVVPGETWNFTAWYRDAVGGAATSNFTDGLAVTFQ